MSVGRHLVVHYAEGWLPGAVYCAVYRSTDLTVTGDWKKVTCKWCLKRRWPKERRSR